MFKSGQKIYRYTDKVEEWTYLHQVHAEHVLGNPKGIVKSMVNINHFFSSKVLCEIDHLMTEIKNCTTEESILNMKLLDHQDKVKQVEQLIERVKKRKIKSTKRIQELKDEFPEEFI